MSAEVERAVAAEKFQDGDKVNGEVPNGNALFNVDSAENAPVKDGRVFKKAKRTIKMSPRKSESEEDSLSPPINGMPLSFTKNSRKPRGAKGRGLPKKGGAGGKGTWGRPGAELYATAECADSNDPNYDSDSQDGIRMQKVIPILPEGELQKAIEPILQEYLEHGDSNEVKALLKALNFGENGHLVAELAVSLALDRHDPHRELTSRLISDLHGHTLSQKQLSKGFDELLNNLQDLTLDTPDAPTILGQFIARAVADDCLPQTFIESYRGKVDSSLVRGALEKAEVLLSMKASIVQLDQVWGQGGGNRPVKYLTTKICMLLREFLDSSDTLEAARCLKELDVPHFHHELVYQAAVLAIEDSSEKCAESMIQLLKFFTSTAIITTDEFTKGVKRVFDDMPEICVDVPTAYALLERLGNKMYAQGVLSDDLMKEMPARGRKRFVSEGDGGKVKTPQLK